MSKGLKGKGNEKKCRGGKKIEYKNKQMVTETYKERIQRERRFFWEDLIMEKDTKMNSWLIYE